MARVNATALAALMAATVVGQAAAQVMVVRTRGPSAASYPSGTLLPAGKTLQLLAGDHLILLDGAGTRQLDGPGRFLPRQPSAKARSALLTLFSEDRPAGARIGAARSIMAATTARVALAPTNIWQIDVASPGAFCVAAGQPVSLWRRDADTEAIMITREADNSVRTLTWTAGNMSLDWPADLPLADGEEYLVRTTDGLDGGVIWRAVDPPSGDWAAFAGQLAQRKCYAQLDTLRASLGGSDGP